MFAWSAILSENFSGQVGVNDKSRPILHNDRLFFELVRTKFDWRKLVGAARCLGQLADRAYLNRLEQALEKTQPVAETVEGVTGSLCWRRTGCAFEQMGGWGDAGIVVVVAAPMPFSLCLRRPGFPARP